MSGDMFAGCAASQRKTVLMAGERTSMLRRGMLDRSPDWGKDGNVAD